MPSTLPGSMALLLAVLACSSQRGEGTASGVAGASQPTGGNEDPGVVAGRGDSAGSPGGGQGGNGAGDAAGLGAAGRDPNGGASAMGGIGGARSDGGTSGSTSGSATQRYDAIYSGVPWYDDQGNIVSAHGAGLLKDGDKYYLFGERHSDTSNAFAGFNVYSSTDLKNWKFEREALGVQASGRLSPDRVGERPKVMKCPSTGEYVMFMHTDNLKYTDQAVGFATSPTVAGPYSFKGALPYDGRNIALWDLGAFQDENGDGYLLLNGGDVYQLASDYHAATSRAAAGVSANGESPAMFKVNGTYFFLLSNKTSWERNDNYYFTAPAVSGPWTSRGKFTPGDTLTWNSQTTFVLPIAGSSATTYLFMGDRWSYPRQGSAATYVWQPLMVDGTSLSIPAFHEAWAFDATAGSWAELPSSGTSIDDNATGNGLNQLDYAGSWTHTGGGGLGDSESRAATSGDTVSFRFSGTDIKLYGVAAPDGGYATLSLMTASGASVATGTLDFYSKYRDPKNDLRYVSPHLASGSYTLKLTVAGDHGTWSDKAGTVFGSTGNYVSVDRIVVSDEP